MTNALEHSQAASCVSARSLSESFDCRIVQREPESPEAPLVICEAALNQQSESLFAERLEDVHSAAAE
tara:strand:+ start:826 stop:1029 length:204 start_codon:yes stop_codon:yes gene_type:complete